MNKKIILILNLLLVISIIGFSQEFPKSISKNHVLVEGTNVYMIPPESFKESENFIGFESSDDQIGMILILIIPKAYTLLSRDYIEEIIDSNDSQLRNKKVVNFSGFKGQVIEYDILLEGLEFSKFDLIFGDEKSTVLVQGFYLKNSPELGEKIINSIKSVYIEDDLDSDSRNILDYSLNEKLGGLKFNTALGNGMFYNRDLKTPTESKDQLTLFVGSTKFKNKIENKKLFCSINVREFPGDYTTDYDKEIKKIKIDNLIGYELYAKNNSDDTKEMYQVILFDDERNSYYAFIGTYLEKHKKANRDLKKVINSFKQKK